MTDSNEDRPFIQGTHWMPDRGKLYRFSDRSVVVIRPWPSPQAWRKREGGAWQPICPRIDLRVADVPLTQSLYGSNRWAYRANQGQRGEAKAWQTVPAPIREVVPTAHLAGYQWQTLSMIARCPGALELARNSPMIAAMIAVGNRIRPQPVRWLLRSCRALLRTPDGYQRWSRICRWLGLDDSKSFVRMTRRVELVPFGWPLDRWRAVLDLWETESGRKLLRHCPRITEHHGELFEIARLHMPAIIAGQRIRPSLLEEVAEGGAYTGAVWTLGTTLQMWQAAWDERPLPDFRSLEQLEQLREDTLIRLAERRQEDAPEPPPVPQDFPPPPLAGWPTIRPLESSAALSREGREMNHCMGNESWNRLARLRQGFGYSVQYEKERASVWIMRTIRPDSGFAIEQLRGPKNSPVSTAVRIHVESWLRLHDQWARYRSGEGPMPTSVECPPIPETWNRPKSVDRDPITDILFWDDIPF